MSHTYRHKQTDRQQTDIHTHTAVKGNFVSLTQDTQTTLPALYAQG